MAETNTEQYSRVFFFTGHRSILKLKKVCDDVVEDDEGHEEQEEEEEEEEEESSQFY